MSTTWAFPAMPQVDTPYVEPPAPDQPSSWFSVSYAHLFETDVDNLGVDSSAS